MQVDVASPVFSESDAAVAAVLYTIRASDLLYRLVRRARPQPESI